MTQLSKNNDMRLNRSCMTLLCLISLFGVVVFALTYGQVHISFDRLFSALMVTGDDPIAEQIVLSIRLPRVLTAVIAGAALGISGVLMQTLFRNPMADAWSLGLLAGGQLGVALIVTAAAFAGPAALDFISGFKGIGLTAGAVIGIACFAMIMIALARRVGNITLLVVGLMLGFTVQGLVSIIMHFANRIGGRVFSGWNDGTFAATQMADVSWLLVPIMVGVFLAIISAKGLSAMQLGETYAKSIGMNTKSLRWLTLTAVVLLVAPVTAFCGPVTFIGLIVPHFARAIARTSQILPLLPVAAVCGALLATTADAVVHLPWEQHFLHLNAILALIGAPVVIVLLVFSKHMRGTV